jgi:hypothetical protein
MHADCVAKFNQPAIEAKIGESWNTRLKPVGGEVLKDQMPDEYAEMEDRYGTSE